MARNSYFYGQPKAQRQAPNLRNGAGSFRTWSLGLRYQKDPNKETFVARPGRGASGESSN
jgi:hypothetical protein